MAIGNLSWSERRPCGTAVVSWKCPRSYARAAYEPAQHPPPEGVKGLVETPIEPELEGTATADPDSDLAGPSSVMIAAFLACLLLLVVAGVVVAAAVLPAAGGCGGG
jgi:hypothetical protein